MRKIYNASILAGLLLGALCITSCNKADDDVARVIPEKPVPMITGTKGIYMLCEGNMGNNDSKLTYYDIETGIVENDYFKKVNNEVLGETANDLKAYGSKMYCVVSGIQGQKKSFVKVIDIATGKLIKTIPFNSATDGQMPRYVAFYKNKAYVSRYDGVISRIDTAALTIDAELQLMNGTDKSEGLEGLAVTNGKLYVTNSSHPYYPKGSKDKVTVIDLNTFKAIKEIAVIFNPVKIAAAENGDLLVVSWGNYGNVAPGIDRINSVTDAVTKSYDYNVGPMAIYKNEAYLITDWNSNVKKLNLSTDAASDFVTDNTQMTIRYGVTVNPFNENVVITDVSSYGASSGTAYVFNKAGKRMYEFETGTLPQHAVFVYNYKLP